MTRRPDIQIIDLRKFSSFEDMLKFSHSVESPRLFLVRNADQEAEILRGFVSLMDEVCVIKNIDTHMALKMEIIKRRYEAFNAIKRYTDSLTGVKSRSALESDFDFLRSGMDPTDNCSLIMVDLDNFKRLNDQFGHQFGDHVLKKVGSILKKALNNSYVYRLGGEEFAIIYLSGGAQSFALAEYLREEIMRTEFTFLGETASVTASFGVATGNGESKIEDLVKAADTYLYQAKCQGRNKVVCSQDFSNVVENSLSIPEVVDFENRMNVATQRLMQYLSLRYRNSVKQIQDQGNLDGLTGVYVRRYFDSRFKREVENAIQETRRLSVIFIDLDHFGQVNKTYGFLNGDRVLSSSSKIFKECIRTVDWIGRYGGEEFCIVLPGTGLKEAIDIADRILNKLRLNIVKDEKNRQIAVTASLGVGEFNLKTENQECFIKRVSNYTLTAKKLGRNQIFAQGDQ